MLHALIAATGEALEYGKAAGRAIALGFALTEATFFYGLVAGLLAAFIV